MKVDLRADASKRAGKRLQRFQIRILHRTQHGPRREYRDAERGGGK